jgi:uncharacterized membrane-anchored protein YhcB (DUF1043 family)
MFMFSRGRLYDVIAALIGLLIGVIVGWLVRRL